ncbi:hypothetical protein HHI36_023387 [Cryptolaemus montrouzieri]|uniref:Uncharacterized protein n=1 Tax=Cryptolaemus montrouzieri TaxID=559131 RepID=A0ABD2PGR0_9CUCU
MNLNDPYQELALYLVQAQNDIAQVFQNELTCRNSSDIITSNGQQSIPEIDHYSHLGAYPKADQNVHKVHFAETNENVTPEPPVANGQHSPSYPENGNTSPTNGRYLKSCLKNPRKNKMNQEFVNPRTELVTPYNMTINLPFQNQLAMQKLDALQNFNASRNYSYLLNDYLLHYPTSHPSWPNAYNTISLPTRQYLSPNEFYQTPNLYDVPPNRLYQPQQQNIIPPNNVYLHPKIYEDPYQDQVQNEYLQPILYQEEKQQEYPPCPSDIYQDHIYENYSSDEYLQHKNSTENTDDGSFLRVMETIKADIQEIKERYEKDDEIERNRYLTNELDQILALYKSNLSKEKETDILSDVTSNSSFQSVPNSTQTSPHPPISSSNLSKAECSSSPCLTSVSDNDIPDDNRSISSSEGAYHTPPDWVVQPTPQAVLRGKSSSAPVLKNKQPKVNKQARSQSDRHLDEIEAIEACKWLKATGFPQYAQMFEDMQFPIDLATVTRDHPRLDPDALASLFRRLQTLNSCAHLHQQRMTHNTDESEDENYALSKNWTFQTDIRRWSRACIVEPNLEHETQKVATKTEADEVFEENETLKDRVRRAGSVKSHRRREGVIISESGAKLLDSLSEQLSGISIASGLNYASDSELTPKFYNRLWRKSSERETEKSSCENRITFQESAVKDVDSNVFYCKFSAQQLGQLERIAMLKLTAYIEKYCPTHRTGWNWEVPKNLIRKMKNPAYKVYPHRIGLPIVSNLVVELFIDKVVFGVPIQLTLQRTGHPLPRNIENALEWLQQNAADQVGLFRKSGVKSRIQTLRNAVESSTAMISFEEQQPYDVADMVKQYFRELPEALLTNKLSETFKLIFQFVPVEHRLDAVLCGIFLMPDEHKEVLQTLVSFLISIAKHSNQNQMNESNLATCFAPSLFHYSQLSKPNLGCPHPKDLAENKAAHDCLRFFLENHEKLFMIPKALLNQCNPVEMREWKVLNLNELGKDVGGWKEYLKECEQAHLKEVKDKSRGWTLLSNPYNPKVEIYFKKIDDGLSVRVWKVMADVDAPPSEVMHRILRERHVWDLELMSAKIVMQLDKNTEIFQYGRKRMSLLPIEEYCVVRQWKSDFPKGACLIVETSVEHEEILHIPDSIRGIIHASRYFIEPCGSGRSRIYHMCRTDTMGRKPEFYYKNYGHVIAAFISNIQNSFYQQAGGPESKV